MELRNLSRSKGAVIGVKKIFRHKRFGDGACGGGGDIAILELVENVPKKMVQKVSMPGCTSIYILYKYLPPYYISTCRRRAAAKNKTQLYTTISIDPGKGRICLFAKKKHRGRRIPLRVWLGNK